MIARCKKCNKGMELVEIDDRQEWSWNTYRCDECNREVTIKVDKQEVQIL